MALVVTENDGMAAESARCRYEHAMWKEAGLQEPPGRWEQQEGGASGEATRMVRVRSRARMRLEADTQSEGFSKIFRICTV